MDENVLWERRSSCTLERPICMSKHHMARSVGAPLASEAPSGPYRFNRLLESLVRHAAQSHAVPRHCGGM